MLYKSWIMDVEWYLLRLSHLLHCIHERTFTYLNKNVAVAEVESTRRIN